MLSPLHSALSGLQASSLHLQSSANNIANSRSEGFQRTRVVQTAEPTGTVRTTVETVNTPGPSVYEETTDGVVLVEYANVDLARELTDTNLSKHLFRANLKALQTADEMLGSLLTLKA